MVSVPLNVVLVKLVQKMDAIAISCNMFLFRMVRRRWRRNRCVGSFMNESPSDKLIAIYFHLFGHSASENGRNNYSNNNLADESAVRCGSHRQRHNSSVSARMAHAEIDTNRRRG